MAGIQEFRLTEEHVKLLCGNGRYYVEMSDWGENPAPAVNSKRPYGNSDVAEDVAEILGWKLELDEDGYPELSEEQEERAEQIHSETADALQVILNAKSFEPGLYRTQTAYHIDWVRVGD